MSRRPRDMTLLPSCDNDARMPVLCALKALHHTMLPADALVSHTQLCLPAQREADAWHYAQGNRPIVQRYKLV